MMTNLLLIGNGKWGKNYVSTLSEFPGVSLTIANRQNWKHLIDQDPDGVMICTPPQSHIEIASYALERDIPTMIEKPLALSLGEAQILRQYTAPILVNHIHLFANRFQYIKGAVDSKRLGDITDIYSVGLGDSLPRDYSELWDYGPHDVAMILDLMQRFPDEVYCQRKRRSFVINMIFGQVKTYSLVGSDEYKDRFLDVGMDHQSVFYDRRDQNDLPLTNALQVFVAAIHGKPDYRLGLGVALKVTQVLEMCEESMKKPLI